MDARAGDSALKRLFRYNRAVPDADIYRRIEEIEQPWIDGLLASVDDGPPVCSRAEWVDRLTALLAEEEQPSPATRFIAEEAGYEQFRIYVREFAADGLTEAQNFFPAIARLPIKAQMALMRVLIDEFGCGNLRQAHSHLYQRLLTELGLPGELDAYVDDLGEEMLGFLNIFYWLTQRAPTIEYFLGALAYLEAGIPSAFAHPAAACARLGIEGGRYYTEHIHIDNFHKDEMQTAIREYEAAHGLDPAKVWAGARMLSQLLGAAVAAAVAKARRRQPDAALV